MIHISDKARCCGCGACVAVCPGHCIVMAKDAEGFYYPRADENTCIQCKQCDRVCPVSWKEAGEGTALPKLYAAYTKDSDVRNGSSSGGIFPEIAANILQKDGVVFGAAFSDDFTDVRHIAVEEKEDLWKLCGSKYVQSNIQDNFDLVKATLEEGRIVLFTGTPCQISGLKSFLKKEYNNLYTQDLICHGTPSPGIWKQYVRMREQVAASTVREVFFRDKKHGWRDFSLKFIFANGKTYQKNYADDLYTRGFMHNIYLRPSCYQCAFRQINRISDITLADFWGIHQLAPEIDDDRGTSLIMVHTEKGTSLLNAVRESLVIKETDEKAFQFNAAVKRSPTQPDNRELFMQAMEKEAFSMVLSRFCKVRFCDRLKRWYNRLFGTAVYVVRNILPRKH